MARIKNKHYKIKKYCPICGNIFIAKNITRKYCYDCDRHNEKRGVIRT